VIILVDRRHCPLREISCSVCYTSEHSRIWSRLHGTYYLIVPILRREHRVVIEKNNPVIVSQPRLQ